MFSIQTFLDAFVPLAWAARYTLLVSCLGIALGLVIGVVVCAMRLSGSRLARGIGALWVSFLRGVPLLVARNRIQAAIRGWLAAQDFTEVDPAALARSPGNEAHLHGFATDAIGNEGVARRMYLHTSPEFAMKKLLAAGETRIAAFSHVWRNRERGPLHHPEFTLLEWYRVGEPYEQLMADCADLLALADAVREAARAQVRALPGLEGVGRTVTIGVVAAMLIFVVVVAMMFIGH